MRRQHALDAPQIRCAYAAQPQERPDLSATVRYGTTALCAHCQARRSTLGKGQPPQPLPPQPPLDILAWLREADERLHTANAELTARAQRAHTHRHTWTAIGTELKITGQAAQQRFGKDHPSRG